ncbi:hypothetical protein ACLKMY_32925, partial [Paraburkholderia mimosarum]|uniref:hypothetical protein n=1 Tax=Paraburkholderia mimosarum TaxID=312026 RepID=UPI0005A9332C
CVRKSSSRKMPLRICLRHLSDAAPAILDPILNMVFCTAFGTPAARAASFACLILSQLFEQREIA